MKININDRVRAELTESGKLLAKRDGLKFGDDGFIECQLWVLMYAMRAEFAFPHMGGPFVNGEIEILPHSASSVPAEGVLSDEN